MAKDQLHIINEEGEYVKSISKSEFVNLVIEKYDPAELVWDENEPAMDQKTVTLNLVTKVMAGDPLGDDDSLDSYREMYTELEEMVKASNSFEENQKKEKEKEKEAKAKEKEEKAKAKEEEEKKLAAARSIFGTSAVAGYNKAEDEFRTELENMKGNLPKGITLNMDEGFGIDVAEGADASTIGEALGYFMAQESFASTKAGVVQFIIGDLANKSMELGLYKSMRVAGEAISAQVLESAHKKLSPRNIESYARMARTIPAELRNPKVDATAYLALSDAPRIYSDQKPPKKEDGESREDYAERIKQLKAESEKYEEARMDIARSLRDGYIEVEVEVDGETKTEKVDLTSRKDVLPLVEKLKIKGGFVDPDEAPKKTVGDWLRQFFNADFAVRHFEDIHEEGKVVYHTVESEAATVSYSHSDLVDLKEEAENNLVNILFGDDLPKIKEGTVTLQKVKTKDGKPVLDKDDQKVMEDYEKKVYPKNPF